ncbi:MAG TPA: Zn-dependent alcohol dehydrogenase [Candidatus Limnocylindrales bacterium]|nr:Zn-dependent alcohol dehydrogenase [Candidatus Limnocylindrales bacterium]
MKAAVCRAFGAPLRIEDVDLDPPERGEVGVRVKACGICQSDLHYLAGAWGGTLPAVYGHEAAGIVTDIGDGVLALSPGDHVVVSLIRACGRCWFCVRGDPVFCEARFRLDHKTPLRARDGAAISQGLRTGAFAEQLLVDASQAVRIPDDVAFESACLLACAVITGFGAAVHTAPVEPGSTVVVIGAGGVGLNTVQAAALQGASTIVAIDVVDAKLTAARALGATDGVNPARADPATVVHRLTQGRGADSVFVTVGSPQAAEDALALARRGGTVVLVGMPPAGGSSRMDAGAIANDGRRILGSKMGGAHPHTDVPALLDLYRQGRLRLDELVTRRYAFSEINDAVRASVEGQAIRNVIVN